MRQLFHHETSRYELHKHKTVARTWKAHTTTYTPRWRGSFLPKEGLSARCFNPPPCNLSSVKASKRKGRRWLIGWLLDFSFRWAENNFNMTRVSLVRVDATVSTVCTATGFLYHSETQHPYLCLSLWRRTGACSTTMFLMYKSSMSMFLASAFDSAFLSRRVMNLIDFSGQRP